jgi:outer membrane protein assembly factor BamA
MNRNSPTYLLPLFLIIISAASYSCSTVRVIPEGRSMLKENKIEIVNSKVVNSSDLTPYLRQQPNSSFLFGWNPFTVIYNWSNGKDGGWDKFVQKIGQAPVVLDTFLVEKSRENLVNRLKVLGYFDSEVTDTIITKRKRSSVKYFVYPGNSFEIKEISHQIKDTLIKKIVENNMSATLIKKGMRLSELSLEEESVRITTLLRERGYYNFTKNYLFFEADTFNKGGFADLYVKIENYTRSETPSDARNHEVFRIRNISLYPDYDPMRAREDSLSSFNLYKVDSLNIFYRANKSMRPLVLSKMNRLKSGDLYSEKDATSTYNRFVALRYYSGVNLQFDEVPASETTTGREVDCIIRLTPSKSQGYKLNLEASSNSNNLLGVSPAISYYHKNIFRGGEWFTLGFMGNFQFKLNDPVKSSEFGISAGISLPSFLLLPDSTFKTSVPRTDINLGYNYQNRPEFTRNVISFNYGHNWREGERLFYIFNPIQLNIVKLFNMNPMFYESLMDPFLKSSYRNHFDLGSGGTIYYTTDASVIPKKTFFYVRWTSDVAGNLVSIFNSTLNRDTSGARTVWNTPYSQYFRSDLTIGYTWRFDKSNALAGRFNIGAGHAYGNSKVLPFEKLFYAGGANSLRGWQARSVGPGSAPIDTTFSIPNQTGDIKIELNAEYRFNMFWNFEGALFVDAGNIWNTRVEPGKESGLFRIKDFYKSVAINWGTGIRLNLDFLVLRLDLGMVVYDPLKTSWIGPKNWFKRDTYALQFGVGYPF